MRQRRSASANARRKSRVLERLDGGALEIDVVERSRTKAGSCEGVGGSNDALAARIVSPPP